MIIPPHGRHRRKASPPALAVGAIVILLIVFAMRGGRDGAAVPSSVDTAQFDGSYRLIAEESFTYYRERLASLQHQAAGKTAAGTGSDPKVVAGIEALRAVRDGLLEQYANLTIDHGVIRSGVSLVQEFSLVRGEIIGNEFVGVAIWHEDIHDPGDCHEEPIRLRLSGDRLELIVGEQEPGREQPVVYRRLGGDH